MDNFDLKKYLAKNKLNENSSNIVYVVIPFFSDGIEILENDVKVFTNYTSASNYKNTLQGSPTIVETTIQ
jgi:hypothetical protein